MTISLGSIDSSNTGSSVLKEGLSSYTETDLGRDDFLTLLVTQLKHQDPLNPLESTDFTAQLAQYSSLEQLFSVNENLELIKTAQEQGSQYQALNLIGKEIVADGSLLSLEGGQDAEGSFNLSERAECTVLITDSDTNLIREIPLGVLGEGQQRFQWDGRDESGVTQNPGAYGFEIMALNENGESLEVETRITGKVTGVDLKTASPILYVGEIPVTLSEIRDIKVPGSSNNTGGTSESEYTEGEI